MSDAEHLIENAIMALERYPFEEAERYFMEAPINIMMSKDSGCPLNAVWEMAMFCDTTLRQFWKDEWEKEAERWIPVTERLPEESGEYLCYINEGGKPFIQPVLYDSGYGEFGYDMARYSPETLGFLESEFIKRNVTHWKPMPEEPKEENNG